MRSKITQKIPKSRAKNGFTMIEVTLFLAITGLLLIGVLGGTYSSIATQRYNDSVRSFAEFLRQLYGEVISPESIGQSSNNTSTGDSTSEAIYGKIAVFGLDTEDNTAPFSLDADDETKVYTATVVGGVGLDNAGTTFLDELAVADIHLYCGTDTDGSGTTLGSYTPLWGAHLLTPANEETNDSGGRPFKGTVLISRSPASGIIHTAFINKTFDIKEQCDGANNSASGAFRNTIQALAGKLTTGIDITGVTFDTQNAIGFCIESDNSNSIREVRIEADGRNTSAITILDEEESQCRRQ